VPFRLLKCDKSLPIGVANSGNLLVQGDNLLALKALLPYYAGKVKCIYIDPPYNTGNENWIYNDAVNSPEMKNWLGKAVGSESEDLSRHDKWLCMMYPRISLLREMLREDGAIFVSIDDSEIGSLRLMMDEIFGKANFVECITWNKRIPKNDAGIGNIHEYIVVYRKSHSWDFEFTMKKDGLDRVSEFIQQLKQSSVPIPQAELELKKFYRQEGFDRGITLYNALNADYRPWGKINMSWPNANTFGPRYEVAHPRTNKAVKIPDRGWRWKEETFRQALSNGPSLELHDGSLIRGRIWFGKDEKLQPSSIIFLDEVNRILLRSILSMKSDGGIELEQILGKKAKFAYPKPVALLQALIDSIGMRDGDIVFDSFAGSGTTGHAVLKQNAEDGIQRKFVLIEMDANISVEITAERLRRTCEGYITNEGESVKGFGGGVDFCRLGDPLFDDAGNIRTSVFFSDLAAHVYFTETGNPLPKRMKADSPLLGAREGRAVYLLYNGILGDKSPDGGNVLTSDVLRELPAHPGPKVIYGEACRLGESRLRQDQIIFKQIPYQIKVN
jgi:adenine-specific DNA-methyltransferase